jgi:hypothetical protein
MTNVKDGSPVVVLMFRGGATSSLSFSDALVIDL